MSPSRYFIAAAVLLLLGAQYVPAGLPNGGIYRLGEPIPPADALLAIWSGVILIVAILGPIVLTIAGLISLLVRTDD